MAFLKTFVSNTQDSSTDAVNDIYTKLDLGEGVEEVPFTNTVIIIFRIKRSLGLYIHTNTFPHKNLTCRCVVSILILCFI